MKTALLTLILICLSLPAMAADVALQWDANDPADQVIRYYVYQDGAKVKEVLHPAVTALVPNVSGAAHSFYVTAVNSSGESLPSNKVNMLALPKAPANMKITVQITVSIP